MFTKAEFKKAKESLTFYKIFKSDKKELIKKLENIKPSNLDSFFLN
jgi:hypothetical protein